MAMPPDYPDHVGSRFDPAKVRIKTYLLEGDTLVFEGGRETFRYLGAVFAAMGNSDCEDYGLDPIGAGNAWFEPGSTMGFYLNHVDRTEEGVNDSVEAALVQAFIVPRKRQRYLEFFAHPKHRRKALDDLYHFTALDPQHKVDVPRSMQTPGEIADMLRERGALGMCYVIHTGELDGRTLPLDDALDKVIGSMEGALISCVPGELAFYEGESQWDRCILVRAHA